MNGLKMNKINLAKGVTYWIWLLMLVALGCNSNTATQNEEASSTPITNEETVKVDDKKTILFFGNSLTAGFGVELDQSFPGLIQKRIDSLHLNYKVINAGLSGETTASGNTRIEWVLNQPVDVFILELGGNDGLRGIKTEETRKNLQLIINKVQEKYPECEIVLAGMQIPPNMGPSYTKEFRTIFPEMAEKNQLKLIPFLLENVGGIPELNLPDGIHPNEEGHKIVVENVWEVLKDLLVAT